MFKHDGAHGGFATVPPLESERLAFNDEVCAVVRQQADYERDRWAAMIPAAPSPAPSSPAAIPGRSRP